jgi:hypothetical protein
MTTIPSRTCELLISAILEATTMAAIHPVREIPAAIPLVQTAEITPDLRRMEARPALTAEQAAAITTTTEAPDRRSSFKFVAM